MKIIGLLLAFVTIIIDQFTKYIMVKEYPSIKIEVTSFFNLALVYNKGISFGLLNNIKYSNYIFCFISTIIVCYLLKWFKDSKQKYESIGLSLVIGGAIGNIIDRLIYPGVVDFLEFHWQQHYWPSFNVADSAICLGVCILLISSIYCKPKTN
jgi:signal peptidase II